MKVRYCTIVYSNNFLTMRNGFLSVIINYPYIHSQYMPSSLVDWGLRLRRECERIEKEELWVVSCCLMSLWVEKEELWSCGLSHVVSCLCELKKKSCGVVGCLIPTTLLFQCVHTLFYELLSQFSDNAQGIINFYELSTIHYTCQKLYHSFHNTCLLFLTEN